MTSRIRLLLLGLVLTYLTACVPETATPVLQRNDMLLIPTAATLDLRQTVSEGDVTFLVGERVGTFLYVAIYDLPPEYQGGEVVERGDPLWQFTGAITAGQQLRLSNGMLRDSLSGLDEAFFLCREDPLYWAAWSWEETAHFVTFSTPAVNVLTEPNSKPALRLASVQRGNGSQADTFIRGGETERLLLRIVNEGNMTATSVRYSLRQDLVDDLPLDQQLPDILPGDTVAIEAFIPIPSTAVFGDVYSFQLLFTSNDCVDWASTFELRVNNIRVLLTDVRLTRILARPPGGLFWDLCALPAFYDPDIYYEVASPTTLLFRSPDIDDVPLNGTPYVLDFTDQRPPLLLALDSLYTVEFWDDDVCFLDTDPDFIGRTRFRPFDLLERPPVLYDTTGRIICEIHLQWE